MSKKILRLIPPKLRDYAGVVGCGVCVVVSCAMWWYWRTQWNAFWTGVTVTLFADTVRSTIMLVRANRQVKDIEKQFAAACLAHAQSMQRRQKRFYVVGGGGPQ
jgi:hypothetical protein